MFEESGLKEIVSFFVLIPALRDLACVHDGESVSVHACTSLKSSFCSKFCHLLLLSAGLVAALVSFNVRVHTTLKQLVWERRRPACISLVGMFVFVVLRPAKRGCIA